MPPGPHVLYVLGTRTSLGRSVRTAYRGTPGGECLRVVPGPGDTLQMAPGPGGGVDVYLNQLQLGGGHAKWARLREAVLDPESTPQSIATT